MARTTMCLTPSKSKGTANHAPNITRCWRGIEDEHGFQAHQAAMASGNDHVSRRNASHLMMRGNRQAVSPCDDAGFPAQLWLPEVSCFLS